MINNHVTQRPEAWRTNSPRSAASTEPQRSIPAALVAGLAIVTVLYLAMNAMYLYALPIDAMSGLLAIAEKASVAMFGLFAADVVAAILALALLGSMSAMVLAGPRVYFAMACSHAASASYIRREARRLGRSSCSADGPVY